MEMSKIKLRTNKLKLGDFACLVLKHSSKDSKRTWAQRAVEDAWERLSLPDLPDLPQGGQPVPDCALKQLLPTPLGSKQRGADPPLCVQIPQESQGAVSPLLPCVAATQ